jgi:hypothetical protein
MVVGRGVGPGRGLCRARRHLVPASALCASHVLERPQGEDGQAGVQDGADDTHRVQTGGERVSGRGEQVAALLAGQLGCCGDSAVDAFARRVRGVAGNAAERTGHVAPVDRGPEGAEEGDAQAERKLDGRLEHRGA